MHMTFGAAAAAAIFACTIFLLPAEAADATGITEREKRDCQADYKNYCSEYGLGTNALRACMSRNIKKISRVCVAALVDAGEMSQAQANKLRASKASTKKKPTTKKKTTTKKPTTKKYTSSKKKK
jgi:hypothetical protein